MFEIKKLHLILLQFYSTTRKLEPATIQTPNIFYQSIIKTQPLKKALLKSNVNHNAKQYFLVSSVSVDSILFQGRNSASKNQKNDNTYPDREVFGDRLAVVLVATFALQGTSHGYRVHHVGQHFTRQCVALDTFEVESQIQNLLQHLSVLHHLLAVLHYL